MPRLVAGDEDNLKVTTAEDLAAAERQLAARLGDVRVGQGFDVHAFGPGDQVVVCGVDVPHGAGLVGHSDADVGLHALTDAVLGAIGAGDIGCISRRATRNGAAPPQTSSCATPPVSCARAAASSPRST